MEPSSMEGSSTSEGCLILLRHSAIVKSLLSYRRSEDDERWAEKAVNTLVKKLRPRKVSIEDLERALSCPGAPSKCVTIPRNRDSRVQILNRRGLPHVIYCRIWRWPDLQSQHELTSLPECQFGFSMNLKEICVNPYHYNRLDAVVLPPVVPVDFLQPFQQLGEPSTSQTATYTEDSSTGLDLDASRRTSSISQPQKSNLVEWKPRAHNSAFSNLIAELNIVDHQPKGLQPPPRPINCEEQDFWASISYFELNHQVSEVFNCSNTHIMVDGFTNPDQNGDRFCVGSLSSIHRNSTIDKVRKHIGKGIHISYLKGEVQVECLSSASIFVQSKLSNLVNKSYPSTVSKISTGSTMKVFDSTEFAKLLSQCTNCSFESVFKLTEMCIIRIAFVKGFGTEYNRAEITDTPAWIEIRLNGPLKWLDRMLFSMGGPTDSV